MKRNLSLERKRSLTGYLYLIPWILGILLFFLYPLIMTIIYSVSKLDMQTVELSFVGIKNFSDAFLVDSNFLVLLTDSVLDTVKTVPLILIFSFFIAMMLRKDFRGSTIVKGIFFLTVILSSDVFSMMLIETATVTNAPMLSVTTESASIFSTMDSFSLDQYLVGMGINSGWIAYISSAIDSISDITIRSGIQIFIFLAGLHAIPASMYEAANIEGSTAWENIWKITLPLMTPIILVNLIYTIVDSFETLTNPMLSYISGAAFTNFNFGYSAAMSLIYFVIILALLAIVALFMRNKIYYQG